MMSPGSVSISSVWESGSSCTSSAAESRPSSSATFRIPLTLSFKPERVGSPAPSTPEEPSPTFLEPHRTTEERTHQDYKEEPQNSPSVELIEKGLNWFKSKLPKHWVVIADSCGFHLILSSSVSPLAIQREVFISFNGNVMIYLHCTPVPSFQEIFRLSSSSRVIFDNNSIDQYCQFGLSLVKQFLMYNSCVGANDLDTKHVWYMVSGTYHDTNPYFENNYEETCRSLSCRRIVELGHGRRCKECAKVQKNIGARKYFLLSPTADRCTSNENLTREQAMNKISEQTATIRRQEKQVAYHKLKNIMDTEGVNIDDELSEQFTDILLSSSKLSENQKMFLLEQWSQSNKSDSRTHRWHPAMIRLALHIYTTSPAGYHALKDTGVLKLPCARTLFDYSHAIQAKEGVHDELLTLLQDKVQGCEEKYKKYHVLLYDGMHISQNLVFRKQDGVLVGYSHIDDVKEEVTRFEKYLDGKEPLPEERQLATEILA